MCTKNTKSQVESCMLKVESSMDHNNIQDKTFQFAIRTVRLCKLLRAERKEYALSGQLLKSGTSIGANVTEAQHAQSRADFLSKLNIALKEAAESKYWIRLLHATDYLTDAEFQSIHSDCMEIEKILVTSVKSIKG